MTIRHSEDLLRQTIVELATSSRGDSLAALLKFKQSLNLSPALASVTLRSLIVVLEQDTVLRDHFAQILSNFLVPRKHHNLYADTGVMAPQGMAREFRARLAARLLPHAPRQDSLRDGFLQLFTSKQDMRWLEQITLNDWADLFSVLIVSPNLALGLARSGTELQEAITLLAARIAALGVDPDVMRYMNPEASLADSAFLAVQNAAQAWRVARLTEPLFSPRELLRAITTCENQIQALRDAAHTRGTSLSLTHDLQTLRQACARLRELTLLSSEINPAEQARRAAELFVKLLRAQSTENSLFSVLRRASDDVAIQITEHTRKSGEHYVTDNRAQWLGMFRAAAGAGVVIGFMALIKFMIFKAHMAPLWNALANCLNYGLGFVVVQLLHFTIATKQPAMTAALLAARLQDEDSSPVALARLTELIVQMVRTQVVAVVGNITLAIPTSLLIFYTLRYLLGGSVIDIDKSQNLLADINPLTGLTLMYAAIAGICLFMAAVISGYFDNLCVYSRVPERLAAHPLLQTVLGRARAQRLADYVSNNLGALAGNFSFGFMLGGVGFLGFLTGLPLDVRHVTLSSANTTYAFAALDWQVAPGVIAISLLGLALIGVVNLSVSFVLALGTAVRARGVRYEKAGLLIKLVFKRLLRRPLDFFWAPVEMVAEQKKFASSSEEKG